MLLKQAQLSEMTPPPPHVCMNRTRRAAFWGIFHDTAVKVLFRAILKRTREQCPESMSSSPGMGISGKCFQKKVNLNHVPWSGAKLANEGGENLLIKPLLGARTFFTVEQRSQHMCRLGSRCKSKRNRKGPKGSAAFSELSA